MLYRTKSVVSSGVIDVDWLIDWWIATKLSLLKAARCLSVFFSSRTITWLAGSYLVQLTVKRQNEFYECPYCTDYVSIHNKRICYVMLCVMHAVKSSACDSQFHCYRPTSDYRASELSTVDITRRAAIAIGWETENEGGKRLKGGQQQQAHTALRTLRFLSLSPGFGWLEFIYLFLFIIKSYTQYKTEQYKKVA